MVSNDLNARAGSGLESASQEQTPMGAFLRLYRGSRAFTQAWRCEFCGGHNHDQAINCVHCERLPKEPA